MFFFILTKRQRHCVSRVRLGVTSLLIANFLIEWRSGESRAPPDLLPSPASLHPLQRCGQVSALSNHEKLDYILDRFPCIHLLSRAHFHHGIVYYSHVLPRVLF